MSVSVSSTGGNNIVTSGVGLSSNRVENTIYSATQGTAYNTVTISPADESYCHLSYNNCIFSYNTSDKKYSTAIDISTGDSSANGTNIGLIYNWKDSFKQQMNKVTCLGIYVNLPSGDNSTYKILPSGIEACFFRQGNGTKFNAMNTFVYYPLYSSNYSSVIGALGMTYNVNLLSSKDIQVSFNGAALYNNYYSQASTITCNVEFRIIF